MDLFVIILCLFGVVFLCWYSYQLGFIRGEIAGSDRTEKAWADKETALRLNYHFVPRDGQPKTRYRN